VIFTLTDSGFVQSLCSLC